MSVLKIGKQSYREFEILIRPYCKSFAVKYKCNYFGYIYSDKLNIKYYFKDINSIEEGLAKGRELVDYHLEEGECLGNMSTKPLPDYVHFYNRMF